MLARTGAGRSTGDELELIGTKIGCNTVIAAPVLFLWMIDWCVLVVLAAEVEGKSVQTVEGVADEARFTRCNRNC